MKEKIICIILLLFAIGFIGIGHSFKKVETEINEIRFEKEYIDYSVIDSISQ